MDNDQRLSSTLNIVYDWSINLLFGVVDISQGALCLSPCVVASLIQCPKLQRKYLLNAGVLSRSVVTLLTTIHQPWLSPAASESENTSLGGSASLLTCVVYRHNLKAGRLQTHEQELWAEGGSSPLSPILPHHHLCPSIQNYLQWGCMVMLQSAAVLQDPSFIVTFNEDMCPPVPRNAFKVPKKTFSLFSIRFEGNAPASYSYCKTPDILGIQNHCK